MFFSLLLSAFPDIHKDIKEPLSKIADFINMESKFLISTKAFKTSPPYSFSFHAQTYGSVLADPKYYGYYLVKAWASGYDFAQAFVFSQILESIPTPVPPDAISIETVILQKFISTKPAPNMFYAEKLIRVFATHINMSYYG